MASHSFPSFFKVLIDPSAPRLPLPQDFVTLHLKNKIPKHPLIQCERGGYAWKLKIEKIGKFYCFTHGWNNVVNDVKLGFGDFLVFWQVDHATFKVEICSQDGCQKHIPPKIKVVHFRSDVNDDVAYGHGSDPSFVSIISNNGLMRLPKNFSELTGIHEERLIIVKSLDGKEWPIKVLPDYSIGRVRYILSSGWSNFRRINGLSKGDECEFKFIRSEGKLCLANVAKKKPGTRGRPRKQKLGKPPK